MNGDRVLGDRYDVGDLLGYGGMAEVHQGRDLRLGRDVAIKMLRTDLARDATFQARFRREAQNAASLNHPAIVAVYDTGEEKGNDGEALPYIVMEFVNGKTLKEVLTAEGPLPPKRALELTADVCAALDFSHKHGIIHRDIKPGNVMLNLTGQVKVMDFGIARAVAGTTTTMTQTSAVIGTAQYLSPEQARGETVDARSDVYATGCVLFELLTGAPPFTGDSPVSVAYQHVREEPKCPSERNPDIPPDVDAVVLKALSKNPANRYQSAAEMRADLLRAANGRPVLAPRVLPSEQRTAVMAAAPSGRGGGTGLQPRVTDPGRRRRAVWVLISLALLVVLALTATGIGIYLSSLSAQMANVPSVVGLAEKAAKTKLSRAGFTNVTTKPRTSKATQKGKVVDQTPKAGVRSAKEDQVTIFIGAGPATTTVPYLVGLNGRTAVDKSLGLVHLKARYHYIDSPDPRNQVVKTEPKADTEVPANSYVDVYLSQANQVQVPDVTGKTADAAKKELENYGFTVNEVTGTGDINATPGTVIDQNLKGGQTVGKNTTVTITIAPESSPSPNPSASASVSPSPTPSPSTTKSPIF